MKINAPVNKDYVTVTMVTFVTVTMVTYIAKHDVESISRDDDKEDKDSPTEAEYTVTRAVRRSKVPHS